MRALPRFWIYLLLVILILFSPVENRTQAKPYLQNPQVSSAYDVVSAVNELRTANGLPPYKIDNALMSAAQSHSDYMAQNNVMSHTGPGGSSPKSRAVAAGYGGGKTVFVSENIAMGTNLSAQGAVIIWQGDSLHLSTMLSKSYQDIGVGVSMRDDVVYYALETGNVSGSAQSIPSSDTDVTPSPPLDPTATVSNVNVIEPVIVSTPAEDGSIVHIVTSGQTLSSIAKYYEVSLDELIRLNNLTLESLIHPGDRLLIRESQQTLVETTESPPTPTQTLQPTQSQTPTPSQTTQPTQPPTEAREQSTGDSEPDQISGLNQIGSLTRSVEPSTVDPLVLAILAMIIVGITLILLGSMLRRRI